jgi:hypothetical protein
MKEVDRKGRIHVSLQEEERVYIYGCFSSKWEASTSAAFTNYGLGTRAKSVYIYGIESWSFRLDLRKAIQS